MKIGVGVVSIRDVVRMMIIRIVLIVGRSNLIQSAVGSFLRLLVVILVMGPTVD